MDFSIERKIMHQVEFTKDSGLMVKSMGLEDLLILPIQFMKDSVKKVIDQAMEDKFFLVETFGLDFGSMTN